MDWLAMKLMIDFFVLGTYSAWILYRHLVRNKDTTPSDWTETDAYYHKLFVGHVEWCDECDPQDNPCDTGVIILEQWKLAKEQEQIER